MSDTNAAPQQRQSSTMQDISGLCVINVKATWQSERNKKDVSIQTQHLSTMESGAQTQSASTAEDEAHRVNACEGTDDRFAVPNASPAGSGWVYAGDHFDEQEVANFLSSVHGDITKELKKISKSSAFENYEPGWKEKSTVGARLINTFPSVVFLESGKNSGGTGNISSSNTNPNHQPLQVTGISWNASNALVAASYGRVDSYTWSTGNGFVAVWPATGPVVTSTSNNNNATGENGGDNKENGDAAGDASGKKAKKSSSKAAIASGSPKLGANSGNNNDGANSKTEIDGPLILLETDAFATCVAFHPTIPTLVAAATFSGEVLLWDISSTDDASASSVKPLCSNFGTHSQFGSAQSNTTSTSSSSSSNTNKDPINKLVWIQNPREPREAHKYLLCSAASDGTVAFWNPSNKFSDPLGLGTLQNRRRASLGVQSIAFLSTAIPSGSNSNSNNSNKRIPTQEAPMVMATDSGDVVRGKVPAKAIVPAAGAKGKSSSASSPTTTADSKAAQQQVVPLNNTEFFESHSGPANAVDASPFFRNVFLTCSSDGSVRLYSLLDMQHKLALVPSPDTKHFLYSASFSPIRPGVIAACSRSSQIHIFDLGESRVKPAFTLDRAGAEDSAVLCLGWASSGSSFASGDAKGCIRIWSVTSSLCETTDLERHAIRYAERSSSSNQKNSNVSPGRNNNNNGAGASTTNALAADGGEDDGRLGGFENAGLTQSMLIAGKGSAGDGGNASGGSGHHVDPVQMLFGFTP